MTGPGSATTPGQGASRVEIVAVPIAGEITPGTDLASVILTAVSTLGYPLAAGDVVVVASKIVAKAEGRYLLDGAGVPLDHDAAVASQTVRVVAHRQTPSGIAQVVESSSGTIQAAAGVDASNLPDNAPLLALPQDPDASARQLRAALHAHGAPLLGVLISDTLGRAWRTGQVDTAIGAAGLIVTEDLAGHPDATGRLLRVTDRAVADEIAAAADLAKGKTSGVPVAIVRGLSHVTCPDDGPGASILLRPPTQDWFRWGHVEAVQLALGIVQPKPTPLPPSGLLERAKRAVQVATHHCLADLLLITHTEVDNGIALEVAPAGHNDASNGTDHARAAVAVGVIAERIRVAAWAEDLTATMEITAPTVRIKLDNANGQ